MGRVMPSLHCGVGAPYRDGSSSFVTLTRWESPAVLDWLPAACAAMGW